MRTSVVSAAAALVLTFLLTAFVSLSEAKSARGTTSTRGADATLAGLSTVAHCPAYGGCAPGYILSGGTATSWSVSGAANLYQNGSTVAVVGTTGYGSFTITAHLSGGGSVSKTVSAIRSSGEGLCP